ncbi:hypothetical protein D3Z45_16805, partial [Lachnospiraceae bacterium]|nr:hypothetical protein [Lachnospiraceae bacterium]
HPKNPALQDSILVFNQDCELVSQLPTYNMIKAGDAETTDKYTFQPANPAMRILISGLGISPPP